MRCSSVGSGEAICCRFTAQMRPWKSLVRQTTTKQSQRSVSDLLGLNAIEVAIGLYFVPGSCAKGKCEAFWTDGSPLDYQFWAISYPMMQDYGGCVHMVPFAVSFFFGGVGRWTNDQCYDLAGYICQKTPTY